MISEAHPLRQLFLELVQRYYDSGVGLHDAEIHRYVANVLTEFCQSEQLYKIRNREGRPLHDVGQMLLESDPVYGPAPSFDREREIRKHIGDYTLFFVGMFPESINRWRLRRQRLESFVDFIKAGKESYYIVSTFDQYEYAREAPVFKQLAAEFESCVYGLNMVKNELQEMQHPVVSKTRDILM